MPSIVLFSGPIASGKTTVADELVGTHGFRRLKSSAYLRSICEQRGQAISRTALQELGDRLDEETDYRWLIEDVARKQIAATPNHPRWLIDSVRKEQQIAHFRAAFGSSIVHIHVWAPEEVLRKRFEQRLASALHHEGITTYDEAISHPNEISARALSDVADVSINLSAIDPIRCGALIGNALLAQL